MSTIALQRKEAAPSRGRFVAVVVTVLLLVFALLEAAIVLPPALSNGVTWGMDLRTYIEHTQRWMVDGTFYQPHQLAGPYDVDAGQDAVYPPVLLYLTVPFAVGVPWLVWWLVPLAIVGAAVVRSRPSPWQLVALAAILVYPRTWTVIVLGNPAMWSLAFVAAGMVWKWPAVFAVLKPVFAPFALVGIRSRSWWYAAGVGLLLAIPFGLMWLDWVTAVRNAQSSRGLEYVLGELPIALLLVAGLTSARVFRSSRTAEPR